MKTMDKKMENEYRYDSDLNGVCPVCGKKIPTGLPACRKHFSEAELIQREQKQDEEKYPCTDCEYQDCCASTECAKWRKWFKQQWAKETKYIKNME